MSRSRIVAGVTAVCSAVLIAAFVAMWMFPFVGQAQTSPDSPGVTVDAGATLLHRAPVHVPASPMVTGTLTVLATLDTKGEVSDAHVLSGPEELRKEALTSVLQWHYQPGPTQAPITIQFTGGSPAAAGQGVGGGIGGGIGGGLGRGVGPGVAGTKGLARAVESSDVTLKAIEFSGISSEAEQQIRSLLPLREGDVIGPVDRDKVQAAVRAFDSHLNATFIVRSGGDASLRVAPVITTTQTVTAGSGTTKTTTAGVSAYRPGGGVTNPVALSKPQPEYSEEAQKAKWQGAVLLSLVVDETGKPANIKVVRPLGLGLDEKAIEAVQQWQFRPGMKDGTPVPVQAQVEVTFRLPQTQ